MTQEYTYDAGYAAGYNDAQEEAAPKRIRTRQKAAEFVKGYWAGWNRVVDEKRRNTTTHRTEITP